MLTKASIVQKRPYVRIMWTELYLFDPLTPKMSSATPKTHSLDIA